MKYFVLALIAVMIISSVYASPTLRTRTYRVTGVADYPGSKSDLSNNDAYYFDQHMGNTSVGNRWTRMGYYEDKEVTASKFKPAEQINYIYFTGHGGTTYACFSNGKDWIKFSKDELGKPENVDYIILACCNALDKRESWSPCFGGSLRGLVGYNGISYEGKDSKIAALFADKIYKIPLTQSEDHVDAWMYANNQYGLSNVWSAFGYSKAKGNLCFWTQARGSNTRNVKQRMMLPPSMTLADGKIKVFVPFSQVKAQKKIPVITTEKENISDISLIKNAMVTRSRSAKKKNYKEYDIADASVKIYRSGALAYERTVNGTENTISDIQATEKAFQFVNKNGGIPENYSYVNTDKIIETDLETGKTTVKGYTVSWKAKVNSLPVEGNGGDGINVIIKNNEVGSYYRMCRKPHEPTLSQIAQTRTLLSPKAALRAAEKEILQHIKIDIDINVVNIHSVYYSPDFTVENAEYIPAYKVTLHDNSYFFINSRTGKLL